jgi:hypothetical protein
VAALVLARTVRLMLPCFSALVADGNLFDEIDDAAPQF